VRGHMAPIRDRRIADLAAILGEGHVENVLRRGVSVTTVLDGSEIVGRSQDTLGEKKPRGERAVVARRAHDGGEGSTVQPHFERLFGNGVIYHALPAATADAEDLNAPRRSHGPSRMRKHARGTPHRRLDRAAPPLPRLEEPGTLSSAILQTALGHVPRPPPPRDAR